MSHLDVSVGVANILLWCFTEVFVVLMTFQATRLFARYTLNRTLRHGKRVRLNPAITVLDSLPYNSDLQPIEGVTKVVLTFIRIAIIVVSVYLGYTLNGAVQRDTRPFPVSAATDIAPITGKTLTKNTGQDISAMAKMSCLRIINNNDVHLYKGYMGGGDILCEDGLSTFSKRVLIAAQIRAGFATKHEGLSMAGMNMVEAWRGDGTSTPGLVVSDVAVTYREPGSATDDSCRIVLQKKFDDGSCEFGVWRSAGSGYKHTVDLKVTTTCDVQVMDFSRLLGEKPNCMPPRMSFLHQFIDAVVVSARAEEAPRQKGDQVVAMISTAGVAVALSVAALATVACVGLWLLLRKGRMEDLMSPRGVASMWGHEKYGGLQAGPGKSELFVTLDEEGRIPYLGSMDQKAMEAFEAEEQFERLESSTSSRSSSEAPPT